MAFKNIQQTIGIPLTAILLGAAIFMAPKILFESYIYYKEVGMNWLHPVTE